MQAVQAVATTTVSDDTTTNTVAIVNSDVTSSDSSRLASFYAIMMASANQASQDSKQAQADLEKLKGQLDAKYIADAINGVSSTDELIDLLDALKSLGMDGPGLDSARDFIKDQWASYQNNSKLSEDYADKAGDYKKIQFIKRNKANNRANDRANDANKASVNTQNGISELKTSLRGEADKLSATQASLNGSGSTTSGMSSFISSLGGPQ